MVAETLEFQGAQVKTALNGKAGLEALEDFDANLILTDLSMPVMNGWELRTRVKNDSKWSSIPVMALSAHVIAGDKERALQTGFEGYLTKPINIRTLLDDIRAAYVKPANHANQTSPTNHANQTSPTNHANQTSPTIHTNHTNHTEKSQAS